MICLLRSSARSSSRPNWLGWTNGRRWSNDVVITSRATSSTERVATTEPSRWERRSSAASVGSDTSNSDTIVSAEPVHADVTTSRRSPSSSSLVAALGQFGLVDDVGVVDRHDAQPVVVGDVHVLAVGLDDVTLVDADLLGVRLGEPVRRLLGDRRRLGLGRVPRHGRRRAVGAAPRRRSASITMSPPP